MAWKNVHVLPIRTSRTSVGGKELTPRSRSGRGPQPTESPVTTSAGCSANSQDERVSLCVEGERTPKRLQLAADAAARVGRPADHDRIRQRDQTHDTAVERVPHLGSR
eukprot:scaffold57511_cov68-Phaeocystis_antarctica.AAC.5